MGEPRSGNVEFSRNCNARFNSNLILKPDDTFIAKYDYSIDYGTDCGGIFYNINQHWGKFRVEVVPDGAVLTFYDIETQVDDSQAEVVQSGEATAKLSFTKQDLEETFTISDLKIGKDGCAFELVIKDQWDKMGSDAYKLMGMQTSELSPAEARLRTKGTLLESSDVNQPLEVGDEFHADEELVLQWDFSWNHIGQLAEHEIIQSGEQLDELGKIRALGVVWTSQQIIHLVAAQPPVLES